MTVSVPPLGTFNFSVTIHAAVPPATGGEIKVGVSDVGGILGEVNYSDYREGDDPNSAIRKIPNTSKAGEVELKRGIGLGLELATWFEKIRDGAYDPRTVTITLMDGARRGKVDIVLAGCSPKSLTGPTLAGKGGGEVAFEALKLVCERVDYRTSA